MRLYWADGGPLTDSDRDALCDADFRMLDYRTRCRLRSHAGTATVDERRLHSMDKCRRCGRAEARAA